MFTLTEENVLSLPTNNEDKLAWCEHGDNLEKEFVIKSFDSGISLLRNPAKHENKYTHDLFAVFPSDLKSIKTQFNTADRYGIPRDYAITINEKDIKRYQEKYPNIVLLLDIEYPSYKGVRFASINRITKLIGMDKAKKHDYIHRVDDKNGNAKSSYVFDLRWFDEITL